MFLVNSYSSLPQPFPTSISEYYPIKASGIIPDITPEIIHADRTVALIGESGEYYSAGSDSQNLILIPTYSVILRNNISNNISYLDQENIVVCRPSIFPTTTIFVDLHKYIGSYDNLSADISLGRVLKEDIANYSFFEYSGNIYLIATSATNLYLINGDRYALSNSAGLTIDDIVGDNNFVTTIELVGSYYAVDLGYPVSIDTFEPPDTFNFDLVVSEKQTGTIFDFYTVSVTNETPELPYSMHYSISMVEYENCRLTVFNDTRRANVYVSGENYYARIKFVSDVLDVVRTVDIGNVPDSPADPYGPGGTSGPGGGGGSIINPGGISGVDDTTSLIPDGSLNPDVSKTGLFTMYGVDSSGLVGLGAALYADTILQNIGKEIMSFLWNSPIDGVISLTMFPFGVGSGGSSGSGSIKLGSLELPISLTPLENSSISINWGSVGVSKTWGNFLDYPPHTKIDLYLPYGTGFVQIDPHEVMDGSISVQTNVDLVKGACCHIVSSQYGVIGTYNGQCGVAIPVTSVDTSGKGIAMVGAAVAAASAVGSVSIGAYTSARAGAEAAKIVTQSEAARRFLSPEQMAASSRRVGEATANAVSKPYEKISGRHANIAGASALAAFRTPPSIARSGSFSTGTGGLSPNKPFIIISVPDQSVPADYGHYFGYPCNMTVQLGNLTGYTEVGIVHLNGISGTEPELSEIEELLQGGVIF